jgi:hypothetical protein
MASSSHDITPMIVSPNSRLATYWNACLSLLHLQIAAGYYDKSLGKILNVTAKTDDEVIAQIHSLAAVASKKLKSRSSSNKTKAIYEFFITLSNTPSAALAETIKQWSVAQLPKETDEDPKLVGEKIRNEFLNWRISFNKSKHRANLLLTLIALRHLQFEHVFDYGRYDKSLVKSKIRELFFNNECFQLLLDALNFEFSRLTSLSLSEVNGGTKLPADEAILALSQFITALRQHPRLEALSLTFSCFQFFPLFTDQLMCITAPLLEVDSALTSLSLQENAGTDVPFSGVGLSTLFTALKQRKRSFPSLRLGYWPFSNLLLSSLLSSLTEMPFPLLSSLHIAGLGGMDVETLIMSLTEKYHPLTSLHVSTKSYGTQYPPSLTKFSESLQTSSLRSLSLRGWHITETQAYEFIRSLKELNVPLTSLDLSIYTESDQGLRMVGEVLGGEAPFPAVEQLTLIIRHNEPEAAAVTAHALIEALQTNNVLKSLTLCGAANNRCFISVANLRRLAEIMKTNDSLEEFNIGNKVAWTPEELHLWQQIGGYLARNKLNNAKNKHNNERKACTLVSMLSHMLWETEEEAASPTLKSSTLRLT